MPPQKYDLIVIGSGSGLSVASVAAVNYGWNVAVVEKGPMGGTCLNRGCIPSKIIIHSADVAETINRAKEFGISAKIKKIDFAAIIERAGEHVDQNAKKIEKNIRQHPKMTLFKATAKFVEPKVLKVGRKKITATKILIAAGARPRIPKIKGLKSINYLTSRHALRLTHRPSNLLIIGGGYIAAELGHFYGALGTEVTIVQKANRLINREDLELAKKFTEIFADRHEVYLNAEVKRVKQKKNGRKVVTIAQQSGREKEITVDDVLVAAGRVPNTDLLKIENSNVKVDENGLIQVDKYMETSQKGIWALGDIVGILPFKHVANWEAQHVAVNIRGQKKIAVDYSAIPHAIFSSPQIAAVGLTEQEAKEQGLDYEIKTREYQSVAMGKALEEEDGFVKFIVDPKRQKILGCHILGPQASILIHEVVVAMKAANGDVRAIKDSIHLHPALNEVVQWAL